MLKLMQKNLSLYIRILFCYPNTSLMGTHTHTRAHMHAHMHARMHTLTHTYLLPGQSNFQKPGRPGLKTSFVLICLCRNVHDF